MTAEIAILNRSAIAFAADSAVTISVDNKTKVYDTAEKLFELSLNQPIAVMIYNNVEFVGVPLDVLIRKFRREKDRAGTPYKTMADVADQFFQYMSAFDHDILEEKRYLYLVLKATFEDINKSVSREIRRLLSKISSGQTDERPALSEIVRQFVISSSERFAGNRLTRFLSDITITKFRSRYADVVKEAANDVFKGIELDASTYRDLDKLAFNIIKSNEGSELVTGLVFGGFAENDMFPTLRYLEVDGIYFDTIKILSTDEIDIDRKKTRAAVVPFAQKEMVERFMFGLDSELQSEIQSFVKKVVDEVGAVTSEHISDDTLSAVKDKVAERFDGMMDGLKESSRQDLLDIVYFMSKKELADIAYALVELTSQKRRFSTEEETVGGPIDVAILTKSEGFIWIKRKHYFDADLNPNYQTRVTKINEGGRHGSKKAVERARSGAAR